MSDAKPAVGDVFEHRYGSAKGKRIRLIREHMDTRSWAGYFMTQTITHPKSPRMVGQTGRVQTIRLSTSQFIFVEPDRNEEAEQ